MAKNHKKKYRRLQKHRKSSGNPSSLMSVSIVCRKCGWRWKPNPDRWRNNLNDPIIERTLVCSKCGTKNKIDKELVAKIWKYNT